LFYSSERRSLDESGCYYGWFDDHILDVMNKQLIEDEQHDNPMDVAALKERMNGFIHNDYDAYLISGRRRDQNEDIMAEPA
jgi:hypothetical protein